MRLDGVGFDAATDAGPLVILHDIDLVVAQGESVAVLGPSGSGKSTLMMLMGGLERPTRGTVAVGGQSLAGLGEDELAVFRRGRVGIVFQAFHLIPTLTALDNVAVPLDLAGLPESRTRAAEVLAAVGLGHRLGHLPAKLSGGEQQRVALARALAPRPRLLLADEPTGNLDTESGRAVADLMFAAAGPGGATLILITHDEALAARCDRVVRLADGRIVADQRR
ncbi:putative transporter subunit: ATP-binding component of ABC superfamily [uncultured Alphaproteobacteria bacterium]|uniref:Putative transporter subunit: ATP-binding component of ABC superfamily n=1 Tax=uncultured Alphaproteobacteria bacterium TaxID=91750 RepID=A0A212K9H4_9PROT|nr:putative transporter subunit: ATP-binding component of ABC superfamily [uncultured Alphaproteobacteria bacterium]